MKLYSEFARVYHDLYPLLIDYHADFELYNTILTKHHCSTVLELGCGTGLYAAYFVDAGYKYTGVDLSADMLTIAREVVPGGTFEQGDMKLWKPVDDSITFDAIIAPGNTFGHLTTNAEVLACLANVNTLLSLGGLFLFDALDAPSEFTDFCETYEYTAESATASYTVTANFTPCFEQGWVYQWDSSYAVTSGGTEQQFDDSTLVRPSSPLSSAACYTNINLRCYHAKSMGEIPPLL